MCYEISCLVEIFFQGFQCFTGCSGKGLIRCLLNDNDTNLQPTEACGHFFVGKVYFKAGL